VAVAAHTAAMDLQKLNDLAYRIIGAAIEIHRVLGPGLLESTYLTCMIYELRQRGLTVLSEQIVPVRYKELILDGGYRLDLIVEDTIVVELKAVEVLLPVHRQQLLSYLKHTNKPLGLLINFNVEILADGVTRLKNAF
jgi:GxxExxY protein